MRGVNRCYKDLNCGCFKNRLLLLSFALLLGDRVATSLREANSAVAFYPRTNAGLFALGIDQHHVRDVDGGLLLGNASLDVALGVRLDVLFDHHDAFDKDAILFGDDTEDAALLALVFACDHFDFVVPLDLDACHNSLLSSTIVLPRSRTPVYMLCTPANRRLKLNDLGCERE